MSRKIIPLISPSQSPPIQNSTSQDIIAPQPTEISTTKSSAATLPPGTGSRSLNAFSAPFSPATSFPLSPSSPTATEIPSSMSASLSLAPFPSPTTSAPTSPPASPTLQFIAFAASSARHPADQPSSSPIASPTSSQYQSPCASPGGKGEYGGRSDKEEDGLDLNLTGATGAASRLQAEANENMFDENPLPSCVVTPSAISTPNKTTPTPAVKPHASHTSIPLSIPVHPVSPSYTAPSQPNSESYSRPYRYIQLQAQLPQLPAPAGGPAFLAPSTSPHISTSSRKTPNVYINGLPPHFSEDHLFALAAPFGGVRSVRTFTRFVGERSSGYGFVLFDTVDAAEKCIEALRRYRNLHPSFSKQIHKIPGTIYATSSVSGGSHHTASDGGYAEGYEGGYEGYEEQGEAGEGGETFKARMERLRDESSTNLYFEGLPLSIDDPTLAALVSPYTIKSSRFFQTKLSHPPRIIAFVRLETRAAAEEIIERLHGRMVRGWNDPGSRISVRFADTSEQRELRRSERTVRAGEQSPARLTIAQAALLNLRGQELQTPTEIQTHVHASASASTSSLHPSQALDLGPHAHIHNSPHSPVDRLSVIPTDYMPYARVPSLMPPADPPYALSLPVQEYTQGDYGHVIGRYVGGRVGHGGARAQHAMSDYHRYQMLGVDAGIGTGMGMDPNMKVLLESLRRSGVPFAGNEGYGGSGGLGPAEYPLGHGREGVGPTIGQGVAQARNGFTPAEELIFQAHAGVGGGVGHGLARDMLGRGRGAGIEVEERGVASAAHSFPQQQRQERIPRNVPVMSEDDFHSNAGYRHVPYGSAADGTTTKKAIHNRHIHPAHVNARLSRDLDTQQQEQEQLPIMASSYQQNQNQMHAHIRSTTLPQRSSSSSHIHQRHHQHSSMSIPISSNSSASGVRMNELQVQLQNQNKIQVHYNNCNSIFEHNSTSNNIHRASINTNINNTTINSEHSGKQNKTNSSSTHDSAQQDLAHTYNHVHIHRPSPGAYDVDISSPPLVSPALTYSSRTPATLSPATPFFGSFGHAGETFEGLDGNAKKAREVR